MIIKENINSPIPYGRQTITEEDIAAVSDVLRGEFLTQGPKIAELEKAFSNYTGSEYGVANSNGTAALHLSALALDVKKGDNWITSPITFVASANCIKYCGGNIYFADIDPVTYTLSIDAVKALLSAKPVGYFKGIIPVDFAGLPVDLEEFRKLADQYGCKIIEDACHAPGAQFLDSKGVWQSAGNGVYPDLSIFSFHPVKHIASGEGGMVTTNDKALYDKLITLRTHGITRDTSLLQENHGGWYYEMQELGYNYRLTDIQAALALSQLSRADKGIERRRQIAQRYFEAFRNTEIHLPVIPDKFRHAYHLFVIQVSDRKGMYDYLRSQNIYCQVHYIPVHLMPYYKEQGFEKGDFQVAEAFYERCLSLPMYPALTEGEQQYVIDKILNYLGK